MVHANESANIHNDDDDTNDDDSFGYDGLGDDNESFLKCH